MSTRGFARSLSAALVSRHFRCIAVGVAVSSTAVLLQVPANAANFDWGGYSWEADRADTGPYDIGPDYGRDDVLQMHILEETLIPNSDGFYQYEGYKAQTGLPPGSSFVSADLYIPESWETGGFKDVALWINLTQPPEAGLSYPTIGFYKDSDNPGDPATIAYWNFDHNEYLTSVPIKYNDWNAMRINYIAGTTVGGGSFELLVNGEIVATMSGYDFLGYPPSPGHPDPWPAIDPSIATVKEMFLNQGTSVLSSDPSDDAYEYDVWWSNIIASLREEYYDAASAAPTAIVAGDMILGTYVDRRGLDWDASKAAWMHAVAGSASFDDGNGMVSAAVSGAQLGLDLVSLGDPSTRAGVTFGYSGANSGITMPSGGDGGSSTLTSPSIGAYLTHADANGYADLLGQYRFLGLDVTAPTSTGKIMGGSIDVAAEVGAHYSPTPAFTLTPFAQLSYQHVMLDPTTLGGMDVAFGASDALIGRVRLLAEAGAAGLKVFSSAGVAMDLLGDKKTTVDGTPFASTIGGPRAEFTGGVEGTIAGFSIFGSGEYDVSFDGSSTTYAGRIGVRHEF